jgi:hypothetical protein
MVVGPALAWRPAGYDRWVAWHYAGAWLVKRTCLVWLALSHPDFCFRIYKLFNKLLLEFILNVH